MPKYRVEYLPLAVSDMTEIVSYISHELKNPQAAEKLSEKFIAAGNTLREYPHKNRVYRPVTECEHEFRRILIDNYGMYYWTDDEKKTVTIARVLYQRRNIDSLLD